MEPLVTSFANKFPSMILEQNVALADKNWFKTGGNAAWYCAPTTAEAFAQSIMFAQQQNLDIFVLGKGANILISDAGFKGLVIRPSMLSMSIQDLNQHEAHVTADAGVCFNDLIEFCLKNNLSGLEEFSGIPGTVGGCVYINIHYYEFLLQQFLVHAQVIHRATGKIIDVNADWFKFGYDQSELQNQEYFLLSATFKLKKITELEASYAKGRRHEIIRHRTRRYPTQATCGSFFRNFLPEEVAHTEKKLIYVAYYLDKLGVKGELSCGDAIVSHQHANMIVNRGHATSADIIKLAQTMQSMVMQQFGIKPVAECQLIGFDQYPL